MLFIIVSLVCLVRSSANPFGQSSLSESLFAYPNITHVGNVTFFLPTNDAWEKTFNLTGLNRLPSKASNDTSMCYDLLTSGDPRSIPSDLLLPCLPALAMYHVAMGRWGSLFLPETNNVTLVPSLLNTTLDTQPLPLPQVFVANATAHGTTIVSGGNRTAQVVASYGSIEGGQVYFIDNVLFPPLPLNNTATALGFAYENLASGTLNATGITAFVPLNVTRPNPRVPGSNPSVTGPGTSNPLDHSAPLDHGAPPATNSTIDAMPYVALGDPVFVTDNESTFNLTALDGSLIALNVTADGVATVNGNLSVVQANIPLSNGVLHILDGALVSQPSGKTTRASAWRLPSLLEHEINL